MIINGSFLQVFIASDETKTPVSVGFCTNTSLSISQELKDIQHKDAGGLGRFAVNSYGTISYEITADHFLGNPNSDDTDPHNKAGMRRQGHSYLSLYKMMMERKPVYICFGIDSLEGINGSDGKQSDFFNNTPETVPDGGWTPDKSQCVYGWCFVSSLALQAPTNDFSTFSITLSGTGPLYLEEPKFGGEKEENSTLFMASKEPVKIETATTKKTTESK